MLLKEACDQSWSFWLQKLAENSANLPRTGVLLVCMFLVCMFLWLLLGLKTFSSVCLEALLCKYVSKAASGAG